MFEDEIIPHLDSSGACASGTARSQGPPPAQVEVGFVGLDSMGMWMAANLAAAGHRVSGLSLPYRLAAQIHRRRALRIAQSRRRKTCL